MQEKVEHYPFLWRFSEFVIDIFYFQSKKNAELSRGDRNGESLSQIAFIVRRDTNFCAENLFFFDRMFGRFDLLESEWDKLIHSGELGKTLFCFCFCSNIFLKKHSIPIQLYGKFKGRK